ncbi:MAG: hypothetical protein HY273_11085 [Gammaproteobacteria bacterium]|nr:hypothetical protein [Gammaproteobacteria bacterium]
MGCLPESGNCERHRTDAFVSHLNLVEGRAFTHDACLDVLIRDSPQPEARYVEFSTNESLVLERKTIVWPLDHVELHRREHELADALSNSLRDLAQALPMTIQFAPTFTLARIDHGEFVLETTQSIHAAIEAMEICGPRAFIASGDGWICYLNADEREASGDPPTGLGIVWTVSDELIYSEYMPPGLVFEVQRHFGTTVRKFQTYMDSRRILLVDPHGSIRHFPKTWLLDLFNQAGIQSQISEIWSASYDWVSDIQQGWMFERII